jgi:predicted unusual protein kinase regulating ubiquinone biosynthesis (AarF/ABC1/UbiB family)
MHASARDPSAQFGAHWLPEPARAPALVILDAGMATALSARDQRNFTDLFLCIAQGEGERAASLLIERAKPRDGIVGGPETLTLANGNQITLRQVPYLPGQTAVHRARFIDTVAGLISEAASAGFLLKGVGVVSTLHALAAAARESYVGLDASFIAVVIAVTVMEGVGRALDDHCDVLTPAVAIAAKVTVRQAQMGVTRWLSGDNAPEAEDAIEENYVTK